MSEIIPIFPLGLVAFPGEKLNLHIFEERYKQLIQDCAKNNFNFGIPPYNNGIVGEIGTEMKLKKIVRTFDDGRMDISSLGKRPFKIVELFETYHDRLYSGAEIEYLNDEGDTNLDKLKKVLSLIKELYDVMQIKNELPELGTSFRIYSIAHNIGLSFDQELDLLHLRHEEQRLDFVQSHLEHLIPLARNMESLRKKIKMHGHFKNMLAPDLKKK